MPVPFQFFVGRLFLLNSCGTSQDLDGHVRSKIKPFRGKIWIYAKNLDTGATYSLDGDQPVRTASTI